MFHYGFTDELIKLAGKHRSASEIIADEEWEKNRRKKKKEKSKAWSFIRKAGPGLGAAAGLGISAIAKKPLFSGVAAGATAGWLPDITSSAYEALKGKH